MFVFDYIWQFYVELLTRMNISSTKFEAIVGLPYIQDLTAPSAMYPSKNSACVRSHNVGAHRYTRSNDLAVHSEKMPLSQRKRQLRERHPSFYQSRT